MNIEEVRERNRRLKEAIQADRIKVETGKLNGEYFVRVILHIPEAETMASASRFPKLFADVCGITVDVDDFLSEIDRLKAEVELREKALGEASRVLTFEPPANVRFQVDDWNCRVWPFPNLAAWLREKESEGR